MEPGIGRPNPGSEPASGEWIPVEDRLELLLASVAGSGRVTVLLHDNPDPDALAAGAGLAYLVAEKLQAKVSIVYRGVIGRAENKALTRSLDIPLRELPKDGLLPAGSLALVDTQPGAGNSPLPAGASPAIVLDHHDLRIGSNPGTARALFSDIQPHIGATSTLVTQYLQAAGLKPPPRLATALFYGIKTDTQALSRNTSQADMSAYIYLLSLLDVDKLVKIEQAEVPAKHFHNLVLAMKSARVYESLIVADLGLLDYPDLVAEVADLLLRLEQIHWAICLGAYNGKIYFSVRTQDEEADITALALAMSGQEGSAGGHKRMAGGQVPLAGRPAREVSELVRQRLFTFVGLGPDATGEPLIP